MNKKRAESFSFFPAAQVWNIFFCSFTAAASFAAVVVAESDDKRLRNSSAVEILIY